MPARGGARIDVMAAGLDQFSRSGRVRFNLAERRRAVLDLYGPVLQVGDDADPVCRPRSPNLRIGRSWISPQDDDCRQKLRFVERQSLAEERLVSDLWVRPAPAHRLHGNGSCRRREIAEDRRSMSARRAPSSAQGGGLAERSAASVASGGGSADSISLATARLTRSIATGSHICGV